MNAADTSSDQSEGVDSTVFKPVSYLEKSPTEVFTMKKASPVCRADVQGWPFPHFPKPEIRLPVSHSWG